ncbi:FAD/NAD(P)-binding oxidoreductase [soil metagenome]
MNTDILIVGAGPAGLAAAANAATSGARIDIIDDNFLAGGQIWRGGLANQPDQRARDYWQVLQQAKNVRFHFQTRVVHGSINASLGTGKDSRAKLELLAENAETAMLFQTKNIILTTGARELLLPFPGWTLPGVMGAGGLQALAKNGFPVQGKRIIVAGSGPLLLAVAGSLTARGAIVSHIVEQAGLVPLTRFALGLLATPDKLLQAWQLRRSLRDTRYCPDSYISSAQGEGQLSTVSIKHQHFTETLACDYLACAYGLIPNTELASALGCTIDMTASAGKVVVNQWQQTNHTHVYCAGETSGIGGLDLALAEGAIAGLAASGQHGLASKRFTERQRWQAFSARLATAFSLRPELRHLCAPDTLVCRCEDVAYAALQGHDSWRSAKLHTRCGMGACQGRVCGAASAYLFHWQKDAGRLPCASARISSLLMLSAAPALPQTAAHLPASAEQDSDRKLRQNNQSK